MVYFFIGLSILFSITLFIGLLGTIVPHKSLGVKTRKEGAKGALGSMLALSFCAIMILIFPSNDREESSTSLSQVSEQHQQSDTTKSADKELAAGGKENQKVQAANEGRLELWRKNAEQTVRDEPIVVEAMFPDAIIRSFWVSVKDDGTRRDGYADYICLVLKDSGMPNGIFTVIRVWDAYSMARDELKELGRSECSTR